MIRFYYLKLEAVEEVEEVEDMEEVEGVVDLVALLARTVAVAHQVHVVALVNTLEILVRHQFAHQHAKTVEPALLPMNVSAILVGLVLFVKQHNAPHCVKMEPPVRV